MSQSIMLPDELFADLDVLAHDLNRSRQELVEQALTDYVELQRWQRMEIQKSLHEADTGNFATEEDVTRLNQKYAS